MKGRPAERLEIAPARTLVFGDAKIEDTLGLILDPLAGKYSERSQSTAELERAVNLACNLWGSDTAWADVHEAHFTALFRYRVEDLVARGCRAVRAAEITVSKLVTAVTWMREQRHIPRDAAPWPKRYKELIRQHWKMVAKSHREPEPFRPRHTLEEIHKIINASTFDPRLELMLWLGVELRLGQVARAHRSDLSLPEIDWNAPIARDENGNDITNYGTFTVRGSGKKGGGTVYMTRGQRRRVDDALSAGYLAVAERQLVAGALADYCLFPCGYVVGRVGFTRGQSIARTLSEKVNYQKPVCKSWLRKNWHEAERRAGVPHVKGRACYGGRRQGRDVAGKAGLSQSAIESFGTWSAGSNIPNAVYREAQNVAGAIEARPARAIMRPEGDAAPTARPVPHQPASGLDIGLDLVEDVA